MRTKPIFGLWSPATVNWLLRTPVIWLALVIRFTLTAEEVHRLSASIGDMQIFFVTSGLIDVD
jgi:hypothetical protein